METAQRSTARIDPDRKHRRGHPNLTLHPDESNTSKRFSNMAMNIQLRRTTIAVAAATLAAAVGSAQAAGEEQTISGVSAAAVHTTAGAGLPVEQRLREELSVVMMDLIQSGAFGNTAPQQIALDID